MPRRERTVDRRATLYTRGDLPQPAAERQSAVIERLGTIAASDSLDAFDVVHWAKRVPIDGDTAREQSLVESFDQWAADRDVSLAPCFDTRDCYSEETGSRRTELVLPVLCLAIYEDDELVEVAPHGTGDDVVTVADCIERLASEDREERRDDPLLTTAD